MLAQTSTASPESVNLFRLATTNQSLAIEILSKESLFEQLSFDQVLTIIASHETLALQYLNEREHWFILDGLALSLLAQKSEIVAAFVLSHDKLRSLLTGLDLARIGQASKATGMAIVKDPELQKRLKSTHLAMLAENQPETAEYILEHLFDKVEPNDLGLFCKNHPAIAKRLLGDKALVRKCDGSTLALMAECHEPLIISLLEDPNRADQLDSGALVILGRSLEKMARRIYYDSETRRRLGALGIARMVKHHTKLAAEVLEDANQVEQFSGACFEQLGECHLEVALIVYQNHRDKMSLDQIVMLGKYHPEIAQKILADKTLRPLLTGKHLVSLGNHTSIAKIIMEDNDLKTKIQGQNAGLIGLHDFEIAQNIIRDPNLKGELHQLDLANLCKSFLSITVLTIRSLMLGAKVSSEYLELLQLRMKTVISICSFIQENFTTNEEAGLERGNIYTPLYGVTTARTKTPPIPDTDAAFVRQFQTMYPDF